MSQVPFLQQFCEQLPKEETQGDPGAICVGTLEDQFAAVTSPCGTPQEARQAQPNFEGISYKLDPGSS